MSNKPVQVHTATILLASGELDKAILGFEIATGMAAMGSKVNMWFIMFGVNCLKKPRPWYAPARWQLKRNASPGRNPSTDFFLHRVVKFLNADGPDQLPLSQLNYMGLGPKILRLIMRRKSICPLQQFIINAQALGVEFKICQVCVEALALNADEDLTVPAKVYGVSTFVLDAHMSNYNIVI